MKVIRYTLRNIKKLAKKNRFICFAAGKTLSDICLEYGIEENIDFVADNNPVLWNKEVVLGKTEKKIKIINPDEINKIITINHVLIITTPYYMQITNQLNNMHRIDNINKVYYFPKKNNIVEEYLKNIFINKPLKNIISFHSGLLEYVQGFDFSDNSRALFEYMIKNNYNNKYKLVWFVKYPNEYKKYKKYHNVYFLSYDWVNSFNPFCKYKYWFYIFNSKFIFFTDTAFWLRNCRKEQIRVNLWHGCGFKDRKNKTGPVGKNFEYMTVTSPMYAKIHAEEFGLDINQLLVTGLAKQDLLFISPIQGLDELLGIKKTKNNIFWLPTFRMATEGLEKLNQYYLESETGLPIVIKESQMVELNNYLKQLDISLIIKLHPVQNNSIITHKQYENITIIDNATISNMDIQINTLLSKADALISDYSSVAVDYMLLDRPIAFTLDDVEEYNNTRGFVFYNLIDWLPGKEIYTFSDFMEFINEVNENIDSTAEKRRKLLKEMHTYHDGNNCKRIVEYFKL